MNYFATPISSEISFENYTKTVLNGVRRDELKAYFNLIDIRDTKDENLHLWGIKKDKINRWKKVMIDDVLFFYRKKTIISWCKILGKFENTNLAELLWGGFQNKHYSRYTWPLIITLEKPQSCNIPFLEFNRILGYDEKYSLRSFFKLNDKFKNHIETGSGNIQNFISLHSIAY